MKYPKALLLVTLIAAPLFAVPGIPAAGEDRVITGGLPAAEYFGKRAQQSSCRQSFDAKLAQSQKLKKELDTLVTNKAPANELDPKAEQYFQYRTNELFPVTEECGSCQTQELGKDGFWKITDGSCYVPSANAEEANKAFDAAVKMLTNTKLFARQNNGFESILEFIPINRKTGALLPHNENITSGSTIDTFIAVKGPANVAFHYMFENKVEIKDLGNGVRELIVRFNGLKQPDGFRPKIKEISLAGTVSEPAMKIKLTQVIGMWYIRNDGYYRYFTAADFGLASIFSGPSHNQDARNILMETVQSLSDRGRIN